MDREAYTTITHAVKSEYNLRGSRFIGRLDPVRSVNAAMERRALYRKEYHRATHHCFAYKVGMNGEYFRQSDDREPAGTAGKPILSVIDHAGLTNVVLVVIRFSGTIRLGTGGLVRAYTHTAREAVRNSRIVTIPVVQWVRIVFPYDFTQNVMKVISRHSMKVQDTEYGEDITICLGVRPSRLQAVQNELRDATAGNISIKAAP